MNYQFRTLFAEEIDCRVGTINENGFTLLLYKDARVDMNLLDEVVGADNWQRDHKEIKGNLYCGVSIWDGIKNQWITKWDCGTESNTEKEKGEASDSFKRACFNWGIGRELYTAPFIYVSGCVAKKANKYVPDVKNIRVTKIEYNENREIVNLVIGSSEGILFSKGNDAPKKAQPQTDVARRNTDSPAKSKQPAQSTAQAQESLETITNEEIADFKWAQGKHEGKSLGDTPFEYIEWYIEKGYNNHIKNICRAYMERESILSDDEPLPWE